MRRINGCVHALASCVCILTACASFSVPQTPLPTLEHSERFENLIGWAYTAVPGASRQSMIDDMERMKALGANGLYIGHNNPGDADPDKAEPGLSYAVYHAIQHHTSAEPGARRMLYAVVDALEAARSVGLRVVLPIGYQIQMGLEWNALHPSDLRTNADGSPMNHWGGGETASPYSPQFRQDAEEYYRWVNDTLIEPYRDTIAAVNLADEPMGGDYSAHARLEFERRYGVAFDAASAYQQGEFQSGVIADYATWCAEVWQRIDPSLTTLMTFHIQREAPWFPSVERIFSQTPDTFVFSADTHLHDLTPAHPLTDEDVNLLYGMVRTLGWLSKVYDRPLMLWTSANAWGLAGESSNRGGVAEALLNARIVHDVAQQSGGRLAMILVWGWNIRGQGVYRDEGHLDYLDREALIDQLSRALADMCATCSATEPGSDRPDDVIHLPAHVIYERAGRDKTSHLLFGLFDLQAFDFANRRIIYLSDGKALELAIHMRIQVTTLMPEEGTSAAGAAP